MTTNERKKELEKLIQPVVEDMGFELFDLELSARGKKTMVQIFLDNYDGVSLDNCAEVSREVSTILDVEDIIPLSYILEVSSPGLDRPLRNPQDFKRFRGKMARVVTHEPIEKQTFFKGRIDTSDEKSVELILDSDKHVTIPYNIITRSRLEIEF